MTDFSAAQGRVGSLNRRHLLHSAACGFGSLALSGLCAEQASASSTGSDRPLAERAPMLPARAKRIIFIFMQGGPSQVDTFDYKPELFKHDGDELEFRDARVLANTGQVKKHRLMKPMWKFRRYGACGQPVSDLFPHIARHVDDLCFLHSLHTNGVAHGPSTLFLHTGATNLIRPSMGAWITYGLGTENQNLPGFITIGPSSANGGPRNYANAFLPAHYQGTAIGRAGLPMTDARIRHITNNQVSFAQQKRQFQLLQNLNRAQIADDADDAQRAVLSSFELAWRMQMHAPGLMDLSGESVRFIQINYADNGSNPRWDQHSKMERHAMHAKATDKPVAGLLADLKARGLLDDTLVWWGGEFGRNPFAQNSDGRDHNPKGFTHFLAGGGVKTGFAYGQTDEFGHEAVVDKVHMHDLHATLLHLLGLDHERLTYRYAGRDFRLTDVEGRIVKGIIA